MSEEPIVLFDGDPKPSDITAGPHGKNYLLSILSVLSQYPRRIRRMFVVDKVNDPKVFGVYFYKDG